MAEKKKTAKSQPGAARGPRRALIGAAVAVAVVAIYAGTWNYLAAGLRAGIEQWATERRAEGVEVSYEALTIGGFPWRLTAELTSPSMKAPKQAWPWTWKGPSLVLRTRPWRLARFKVRAPGLHQLSLMGEDYFIDAVELRGKARYGRGGVEKIRLSVTDLVIRNAADVDVMAVMAFDMAVDRKRAGETAFEVAVEVKDLHLPRELIRGLGRKTARLGFKAETTGDFPDIVRRQGVNDESMARWRDSGGTIEVRRLDLKHGPLAVSGAGTLALDQTMQPIGSFSFRIDGHMQALDRFREAGLINPQAHGLARLVLIALAAKQGAGGGQGLKVPVTIQDRRVFVGPVALAALPLLQWQ